MTLALRNVWVCCLCVASAAVHAADDPVPGETPTKPETGVSQPFEGKWEGAIGPVMSLSPDYSGSAARKFSVTPGYYLRYGRISISNASGFVTRRNKDDVFRGLGLDFKRDDRLRLSLALRLDRGRRSGESPGLAGIENVRQTLRGRSSASYQLDGGWKLSTGWSADLLGRGGGNVLDGGISHDRRLSARTTWSLGAGVAWADHRYLQSYYGITPTESTASGRPAYAPGSGFKDISVGTGWRMEIDERWVALWGASAGKLLGPAAISPLTGSTVQWGLNAAVAWRF